VPDTDQILNKNEQKLIAQDQLTNLLMTKEQNTSTKKQKRVVTGYVGQPPSQDIETSSEEDTSYSKESTVESDGQGKIHTIKEVMVLILVKLKWSPKFKDVNVCLEEGAVKIVDLINKWVDKSEIDAIIGFDEDTIHQEFADTIDY